MRKRKIIGVLLSVILVFGMCGCSSNVVEMTADQIANYPEQTIEFVVPAAAGAAIDIPTRTIVEIINKTTDAQAVVLNMSGASQITGTLEVYNRGADGYSLITGAASGMMLQPLLMDLSYSIDDFRHLSLLMPGVETMIVTNGSSEITSWDELLELLSTERLTWTSSNSGGLGHLAMLKVLNELGVEAEYVSYNGSSEAVTALLGDHIDFYVIEDNEAISRVEEGQVTPILVLSDETNESFPDIPTAGDIGIDGMEYFVAYYTISVADGTPDEVAEYLKTNIDAAIQTEEYAEYLENAGFGDVPILTEEEVTELLTNTAAGLAQVIEELENAQ